MMLIPLYIVHQKQNMICQYKAPIFNWKMEVSVWAPPQVSNNAIVSKINIFLRENPTKPPYERFLQDCISSHWPVLWHLKIEHKIIVDREERIVSPRDEQEECELETCAICYNPLTDVSSEILECRHQFHTMCISTWLKRANTCPMCRAYVCT